MIVAVTGSSGFIGSRLVKQLLLGGHEVIKLDIKSGINIIDFSKLKETPKFDVCVHLAALTSVPMSLINPHDFYSFNINGLINTIELCRIHGAKMVFASSYVYGIPKYLPIDEKHPLEGFNPYAETKIIGEMICANYYKYFGINCIILRPFNVYGSGQSKSFLIPSIIDQAKTGTINLNDPFPKRDYIYIDDVVDCFFKAVENDSVSFDFFNVGFGKSYSVAEIVGIVNEYYNNSLNVVYSLEKRNIEIADTIASHIKTSQILGWKPNVDIVHGLHHILNNQ